MGSKGVDRRAGVRGVRRRVPPSRPYPHTFDRFKNTSDSTAEQSDFKSRAMIKAPMSLKGLSSQFFWPTVWEVRSKKKPCGKEELMECEEDLG